MSGYEPQNWRRKKSATQRIILLPTLSTWRCFVFWGGYRRLGLAGGHHLVLDFLGCFLFFINLQPLEKLSTADYAPFALDGDRAQIPRGRSGAAAATSCTRVPRSQEKVPR